MRAKLYPLTGKVNENYSPTKKSHHILHAYPLRLTFARIRGILKCCPKTQLPVLKASLFSTALLVLFTASCSDLPVREETGELLRIESLTVNPQQVEFTPADGAVDTTVVHTVNLTTRALSDNLAGKNISVSYLLRDAASGAVLTEGAIPVQNPVGAITTSFTFIVRTFDVSDVDVQIYVTEGSNLVSNTARTTLRYRGFQLGLPEILSITNPDTVRIPADGAPPAGFRLQAMTTHTTDQQLLDRVLVDIRDQNNNFLPGSPFQLYDDGSQNELQGGTTSGDLVAGDSTFTRLFQINSGNNPDVYTLFYHAVDNFGTSSDTLQSTMRFIR